MALARDPEELWKLIKEAKADREPFDRGYEKLEDMFVSKWYGKGGNRKRVRNTLENVPFSVAALLLPHMVQNSPRFVAKADGTYANEVFAAGSQSALNLISKRAQWHRVFRPTAFDYLISRPAMFIEMTPSKHASVPDSMRRRIKGRLRTVPEEDHPSMMHQNQPMSPAPPHWPGLRHVARDRWGADMKARLFDEARFLWTETTYDIDDLADMAKREPNKWNAEQIARLVAATDSAELGYAGSRFGGGNERVEDRKQVNVHQIWVPEAKLFRADPERGERGVIYTLAAHTANGQDMPLELARPFYFYGPPQGPLVTGGQYTVSMESVPITMLMANMEQINTVNAVMWSIAQRIKNSKRVYAYDMTVDGDMRAVAARGDGQFQGVQGLVRDSQAAIIPIDFGGVDQSDIAHMQIALDGLSRNVIGSDETLRGQIGSGSTATEVATAFQETRNKIEFVLEGWEQLVMDAANGVRWYVENDTRFFTYLDSEGKEAVRRRQAQPLIDQGLLEPGELDEALQRARSQPYPFQGGDLALDDAGQIDPHSVEIELEAYSMVRRTSAQRRVDEVALNEQLANIGDAAVRQPHINWKQRLKVMGEVWGKPGLEELFDEEVASEIAQIQLMSDLPDARFEGYGDNARERSPDHSKSARPVQGARPGRGKVAAGAAPARAGNGGKK